MPLSRERALLANRTLDQTVPPILRDQRWFMGPMMRILFRDKARLFMDFKDRAFVMTPEEFSGVYREVADVSQMQGETDLNERCVDAILAAVEGDSIVDVGCGRGYLAGRLRARGEVHACDIVLDSGAMARYPDVKFTEGSLDRLPYDDASFDTVVCTHTLEHVQNLGRAIAELRRIARKRLLIVVPKQRPYRYTFNLHIHFFPYAWSLQSVLGDQPGAVVRDLGDWFYLEDVPEPSAPRPGASA